MTESLHDSCEEHVLQNDAGNEVRFYGKLFSETSYYDEDQGSLTRLRLFVTNDGRQVYSIISGSTTEKSRRVYIMRMEDDLCHISNGSFEITLHTDMLMTAVFKLCGMDPSQGEEIKAFLEDSRKIANG